MGFLCVCSWWMCTPTFVRVCASRRQGIKLGGATEPAGHDHPQWQHRSMQGDSLYIPERFGQDRKSYEEVMRTWCFTTKDFNGRHRHIQQVWRRIKILLACHWHSLRSIVSDCEVGGVQAVGKPSQSTHVGACCRRACSRHTFCWGSHSFIICWLAPVAIK